jgi:hypothetical protein
MQKALAEHVDKSSDEAKVNDPECAHYAGRDVSSSPLLVSST